jgi:hypothetical protein
MERNLGRRKWDERKVTGKRERKRGNKERRITIPKKIKRNLHER